MKSYSLLAAFLMLCFASQAQLVKVLYEVIPNGDNHVVKVYLQSTSEQEVSISAANLSLALPATVAATAVQRVTFIESWTDYLEESRMQEDLSLSYEGRDMDRRVQYGNANPGLPTTHALMAPALQDDPLLVMEIQLEGEGAEFVYMEHQSENPFNQIGGADIKPIDYVIEHPKREGSGTEVNPAEPTDLVIYPNPARERVNVRMAGVWEGAYRYTITDLLGRLLFEAHVPQDLVGKEFAIDLANWTEGTYFVTLISESGKSMSRKLVKD